MGFNSNKVFADDNISQTKNDDEKKGWKGK
jgi:hypothetical protein